MVWKLKFPNFSLKLNVSCGVALRMNAIKKNTFWQRSHEKKSFTSSHLWLRLQQSNIINGCVDHFVYHQRNHKFDRFLFMCHVTSANQLISSNSLRVEKRFDIDHTFVFSTSTTPSVGCQKTRTADFKSNCRAHLDISQYKSIIMTTKTFSNSKYYL